MKTTKKAQAVSFCGIAIAMCVILLFLASIIEVLDYTACAICGIIVTFIIVEFGTRYAISVYAGASILALIIIPSKITVLVFVLFCGWYPFVKRYLERIRRPFDTILKFVIFNIALSVIVLITKSVLLLENVSDVWYVMLYVACNFTFILYDTLITKLIWLYIHKYRNKFKM